MQYTMAINEQEQPVHSVDDLTRYLEEAQERQFVYVTLYQHSDVRPTWTDKVLYRSVGLVPPKYKAHISALINKDSGLACLEYVDEEDNTFYSFNPDYAGNEKKVPFVLASGQPDEYPASDCIALEQAIRALFYYFDTGEKPDWIHWVKTQ